MPRVASSTLVLALVGSTMVGAGTPAGGAPADNGKIAFTTDRDGNREIYVMNADGSGLTRLTNDPGADTEPVWSPDGSKIAFTTDRDGDREIYVMNADGSGQINLTNSGSDDRYPAWSPDGTRLTFRRSLGMNTEIFVMNADGSEQTNLSENSASEQESAWSPDGSKIAFVTDRDFEGDWEIFTMNPDGSDPTNLTENSAPFDGNPAWSPDGTKIAFFSGDSGAYEINVASADGSAPDNISNAPGDDTDPGWSPDGTKLVFQTDREDGFVDIYVMNPDGSGQTPLTNRPGVDREPDWQPIFRAEVSRAKAREGNAARFKITLAEGHSAPVMFEYETDKGRAKPGKDFKKKQGSITFAPGETVKKIKVKTKDDAADEPKETFFLEVSYPGGPSDRGKAKITDDD
jgi:Tol biopolymer transport system component